MQSTLPGRPSFCSPPTGSRSCELYTCTSEAQEVLLCLDTGHAPCGPASSGTIITMGNASSCVAEDDWQRAINAAGVDLPKPASQQPSGCQLNRITQAHPNPARGCAAEVDTESHALQRQDFMRSTDVDMSVDYAPRWSDSCPGADLDVIIDDANDAASRTTTQPANSYNSTSTPPPSIRQPNCMRDSETGEFLAAHPDPAHTQVVECGGLGMNALREAMTKESEAQEPLVSIIGLLLDKTVQRNDSLMRRSTLHEFESQSVCTLSASEFLSRIMRYGKCSPCCAVVGLIYLQRIKKKVPRACITSRNLQRLLLVAVMLANKFLDDLYFSNKHWAKIGGLSLQEINGLELTILRLLDWRMQVSRENYYCYLDELGCGPQDRGDPDAWSRELEELKELIASGVGIHLADRAAAAANIDVSTAQAPAACICKSEDWRARR